MSNKMEEIFFKMPIKGARIFYKSRTTSTMDDARLLVRAQHTAQPSTPFPFGSAVIADEQSAGRGRKKGRRWTAARGENLLSTFILPPDYAHLPAISLRCALALHHALVRYYRGFSLSLPAATKIKWPNDLINCAEPTQPKKFAGLLCDATADALFVGIGLNLVQNSFPPGLVDLATSLCQLEPHPPHFLRLEILALICKELMQIPSIENWHGQIKGELWQLGEEILLSSGPEEKSQRGRLIDLAPDGCLIVQLYNEEEKKFSLEKTQLSSAEISLQLLPNVHKM